MSARIAAAGDLWADLPRRGQRLAPAIERLRRLQQKGAAAAPPPKSKPRSGRSGKSREM
jgi:hypothetical protein